jgi:hypothetical protein
MQVVNETTRPLPSAKWSNAVNMLDDLETDLSHYEPQSSLRSSSLVGRYTNRSLFPEQLIVYFVNGCPTSLPQTANGR